MVLFFAALLLAAPCVPHLSRAPSDGDLRDSVVKIIVTERNPDPIRPWQKQQPADASGTGVVIDGKRIITNAHVVRYSTQVRVQPNQSSEKIPAKVKAIAVGIDLALLELEDATFFDTHPPATFAEALPKVGNKVATYGFPIGGEALSMTEGSISRIEYAGYNDGVGGMRIQIDAAINPGNSGGPAAVDGKVVGLCFSGIRGADNIGYVIPDEELKTFLDDVADGTYDGKPAFRAQLQTLENEALRAKLGLDKSVTGLMFTRAPHGEAGKLLHEWDVLTKVGPHAIDNDGMVPGEDGLRLSWHYFVPKLAKEGKVPVTIRRGKETLELEVPVSAKSDQLLQPLENRYPSYFIYGPLVFSPAYADFAPTIVRNVLGESSPVVSRLMDERKTPDEELVVVTSKAFPHRIVKGYDVNLFSVVGKVNGTEIKSLKHLVEVLRDLKDEYVVFEWADQGTETVVFKREEVMKATDEILDDNGVRASCSPDLEKVWKRE
jgi:S1-C subfamily serine protease